MTGVFDEAIQSAYLGIQPRRAQWHIKLATAPSRPSASALEIDLDTSETSDRPLKVLIVLTYYRPHNWLDDLRRAARRGARSTRPRRHRADLCVTNLNHPKIDSSTCDPCSTRAGSLRIRKASFAHVRITCWKYVCRPMSSGRTCPIRRGRCCPPGRLLHKPTLLTESLRLDIASGIYRVNNCREPHE